MRWTARAAVALVVAPGLLVAGDAAWSGSGRQVAVPGSDASPEDVVLAFLRASRVGDTGTVRTIDPDGRLGPGGLPADRVELVGVDRQGNVAHVTFTADYHGDDSLSDGQAFGLYLQRDPDGHWHVTEVGVA